MDEPNIHSSDKASFRKFALRVRASAGMLEQLGDEGRVELQCGSHVAQLTKNLPQDIQAAFRPFRYPQKSGVPSLKDFGQCLEYELVIQESRDHWAREKIICRCSLPRQVSRVQPSPPEDQQSPATES